MATQKRSRSWFAIILSCVVLILFDVFWSGSLRETIFGKLSIWWFLWPIPVWLLYGRAKRSDNRQFVLNTGRALYYGGLWFTIIVVAFWTLAIVLLHSGSWQVSQLAMFLVWMLLVAGIPFLVCLKGRRLVKWATKVKKYLDLIVNQHVFGITQIAAKMSIPEMEVITDLKEMTRRRFLPEAQIDETRKVIIVPAVEAQMRFQEEVAQEQRPAPSMAPAAVQEQEVSPSIISAKIPGSTPPPPMASPRPEVARPQMRACKCCGANNLVWPNREPLCEFCGSIV